MKLPKPAKREPKARKRLRRSTTPIARKSRPRARRATPRAALARQAEALCRRYVMRRDKTCQARICCNGTTVGLTWAHGFGRGPYPSVAADPRNSWAWCLPCHEYMDSHAADKRAWMAQQLGRAGYAELYGLAVAAKQPDLADVIADLKERLK